MLSPIVLATLTLLSSVFLQLSGVVSAMCPAPPQITGGYVCSFKMDTDSSPNITAKYCCHGGSSPFNGHDTISCINSADITSSSGSGDGYNSKVSEAAEILISGGSSSYWSQPTPICIYPRRYASANINNNNNNNNNNPSTYSNSDTCRSCETYRIFDDESLVNHEDLSPTNYGPQYDYGIYSPRSMLLDDSRELIELEGVPVTKVLEYHNCWRNCTVPKASFMPYLRWDNDLAKTAERWAAQCTYGHDPDENRRIPYRGLKGPAWPVVGQNICYASYNQTWAKCIASWASQRLQWRYGIGQIGSHEIGHYTQLVSDKTYYVGCGKAVCKNDWRYILVCNYAPGANYLRFGSDPYKTPYNI